MTSLFMNARRLLIFLSFLRASAAEAEYTLFLDQVLRRSVFHVKGEREREIRGTIFFPPSIFGAPGYVKERQRERRGRGGITEKFDFHWEGSVIYIFFCLFLVYQDSVAL